MTIQQVTEYFMMKAVVDMDVRLSARKLNSMAFMAQAHSLAMRGVPIVDCTFSAGTIGPGHWRIECHYKYLKSDHREEMIEFKKRVGLVMRGKSPAYAFKISEEESSILDDVYEEYKETKVSHIEKQLKVAGTPWSDVYKEGRHVLIPNEIIKYYYSLPENRILTVTEKEKIKAEQESEIRRIMSEQVSAVAISKWFVRRAMKDNKPLGIYKLMCMCYYAQGQAYKELGHALFWEPIRRRETGPYIAQVYQVFQKWLGNDIDPSVVVKVPSVAQHRLTSRDVPISLEGIYKKYMYIPTSVIVNQALEELPMYIPNDCEVVDWTLRVEFVDRSENHVY